MADLEQGLTYAEIETRASLETVERTWVGDDDRRAVLFESGSRFVPDAIGRAYLEQTGRLD